MFSSLFVVFSTIFYSVLLQIRQEMNLWPNLRRHDTLHFAHIQTRDQPQFTPRHYTPTSHPTKPYLLIPTATSRTLRPTHTPSMKFLFTSVPQIFLSESYGHPWGSLHNPSVNLQPWRFTHNSLGLPHTQSLCVCLSLWVYVVSVCFLLYLAVYLCFERCVFNVLLDIHWKFFIFKNYIYINGVAHIILLVWLYLFHQHFWKFYSCVYILRWPTRNVFIYTCTYINTHMN